MNETAPDYSKYIGVGHNSEGAFAELNKLVDEQHAAEQEVNRLMLELKRAQEAQLDISQRRLPELMDSLGLSTFKTTSGLAITIQEKIRASISQENKPKAFAWLEEHGFGGLIKRNVVIKFGRDQEEEAVQYLDTLRQDGKDAALDKTVHSSTLASFVREQLEEGKNIPVEVFGVFRQREAKIET